jgi:hypothetical protein
VAPPPNDRKPFLENVWPARQWQDRPEGCHCENTKIWPPCITAAGLGLQLHDVAHGTRRVHLGTRLRRGAPTGAVQRNARPWQGGHRWGVEPPGHHGRGHPVRGADRDRCGLPRVDLNQAWWHADRRELCLRSLGQNDMVGGNLTMFHVSVPDDPPRWEVNGSGEGPVALRVIGHQLEVRCTAGAPSFALGPRI